MTTHRDPFLPRPFRVEEVTPETHDVTTLTLVPADAGPGFDFAPAQIGMVGLPSIGEVPISFSGDSTDTTRIKVTIRAVGAVTKAITSLDPGDVLGLRGPYGAPWPVEATVDRHVLIVAGGLGLAPLRSFVRWVIAQRHELKSITLVYGARTPSDLLFRKDLETWSDTMDVHLTVDEADEHWDGAVGLLTELLRDAVHDADDTVVMMCGPDVMMRFAGKALVELGIESDRIWATMERNMKCAVGLCGHCQFGRFLLCKDGPVLRWDLVESLFEVAEI